MKKNKKTNVILSETKNLMRSFTFVQDDRESGRSMVEMLGVLAVMGVLSVGGVAMYTNAMNKYRANELLNESSKRAVVIATQILSGKSISADMINQFDNNGTTFTGVEEVGTNQFKLTLSGVDDDVCTQLKATVGSNTIIQEVGDKCAYLTFNNDLSKGITSSGTNGGSNGGNEQQEPEVACPENSDTVGGGRGQIQGTDCKCKRGFKLNQEETGCIFHRGMSWGDSCPSSYVGKYYCRDNSVFYCSAENNGTWIPSGYCMEECSPHEVVDSLDDILCSEWD